MPTRSCRPCLWSGMEDVKGSCLHHHDNNLIPPGPIDLAENCRFWRMLQIFSATVCIAPLALVFKWFMKPRGSFVLQSISGFRIIWQVMDTTADLQQAMIMLKVYGLWCVEGLELGDWTATCDATQSHRRRDVRPVQGWHHCVWVVRQNCQVVGLQLLLITMQYRHFSVS